MPAGPLRQAVLDLGKADPRHSVAQLGDVAAFDPVPADRSLDDELLVVVLAAVQARGWRVGLEGLERWVEPARLHGEPGAQDGDLAVAEVVVIRGRRLAVEHVLGVLAAGDKAEEILAAYPWIEAEDILACLAYAHRLVAHERIEPAITDQAA